jgi:hypothetical protein
MIPLLSSRASFSETRDPYTAAELKRCGVRVPAFAGTTAENEVQTT